MPTLASQEDYQFQYGKENTKEPLRAHIRATAVTLVSIALRVLNLARYRARHVCMEHKLKTTRTPYAGRDQFNTAHTHR